MRRVAAWTLAALVLAGVGGGVWQWRRVGARPSVPEPSGVWYRRGSDALHDGAYDRARAALEQAAQISPRHALAHVRLAEVAAEVDDPSAASRHLLHVAALGLDEDRLPTAEALRLQAVRALVRRDVDRAVARYRSLVEETPADPRAFVDLGRAEEAAGRWTDARVSYARAITIDGQYAAAHLRLAALEGRESRWEQALAGFAEAERLYKASSNAEGETEVLLSRAAMLEPKGEIQNARRDLDRALSLASTSKSMQQTIRARLASSVVAAAEGHIAEADRLAIAAVDEAMANELESVAAAGLIDLAARLVSQSRPDGAEAHLRRSLELAGRRGATLTVARARLQLAEIHVAARRTSEAVALLGEVLPFLNEKRYRRHELRALGIAATAHEQRNELTVARRLASGELAIADTLGDETQAAIAASILARVSTALGILPEALRLRERLDAIHRRQGDQAALPVDLADRADLLIRMGRQAEARSLLAALDAGVAAGLEPYVNQRRRAAFLHGLQAAVELRCADALSQLEGLDAGTSPIDAAAVLSPAIREFCGARLGRRAAGPIPVVPAGADKARACERHYWLAAAALQRDDPASAAGEVRHGLTLLGDTANDELRWRLTAIGAAAAVQRGDHSAAGLAAAAAEAWGRLRTAWKTDVDAYARRPDLEKWLAPLVPATSHNKEQ